MDTRHAAALAILLGGCSSAVERDPDELIGRIEHNLRLPEGASHLDEYARYYADAGNGEIVAVYLIPFGNEMGPDEACEEISEDFSTREVPCPERLPAQTMRTGERRWLADQRDLPWINDGGCAQIEVTFDKAKSVVKRIECNGEA